jgi:hypothetical protein
MAAISGASGLAASRSLTISLTAVDERRIKEIKELTMAGAMPDFTKEYRHRRLP